MSPRRLHGRAAECRRLRRLADDVGSGSSRVLVLCGAAGVGKTALLDYLVDHLGTAPRQAHPQGFDIRRVTGARSDLDLAYAGLQQLCEPLPAHVASLPVPQRDALNTAFGMDTGPAPERFLVGLAALNLIKAASAERPLLCIVDDADRLDRVSVRTLAFVARRLTTEPVAMVFAVREDPERALAGLAQLAVTPLADRDAGEFLDSNMFGRLDPRVRDRIVAEARGNPRAIREVLATLESSDCGGGFPDPRPRPHPESVEQDLARVLAQLPEPTRRLVITAAADPTGDPTLLLRAAARLGIGSDALAPAEAAGLIEIGPRVRFRHPLLRVVAYRAAGSGERRRVHGALADATDPALDPARWAWHAAHATAGPDDVVAAELETSTGRARRTGGTLAAAAFLERAALLSSDPSRRSSRALAAAHAKWDAGAPSAAYELLDMAELGVLSELRRAKAVRLRARVDFGRSRGGDSRAPVLGEIAADLLDAAHRLEPLDGPVAREAYLQALAVAMFAGRLGETHILKDAAESARSAAEDAADPKPAELLLDGLANRIACGPASGHHALSAALHTLTDHDSRQWWLAFPIVQETAVRECWDDAAWHRLSTHAVRLAHDTGTLGVMAQALAYRAGLHVHAGEFAAAARLIDRADEANAATEFPSPHYLSIILAAWRGDAAEAGTLIEEAVGDAAARREGRMLGVTGYAAAVLNNGLGRYEDAFAAAASACAHEDLGLYGWSLVELIEAATRCGHRDAAAEALQLLEERTRPCATDWALAALAGARALPASGRAAEHLYVESIERYGRTRLVVHQARARLRYGEWLRRANRRGDARVALGAAYDAFVRIGAKAFAERARRELAVIGERSRKAPVRAGDTLTAQEAQIAQLAGTGLTNHEIGTELFLSPHTVEWHLRKVFVKLAITSRRQLRTR
ncbi:AAA family ATPase [Mycobacterium sp. NPDC003449]